jgi:DNA-binding response OmpR family regulator
VVADRILIVEDDEMIAASLVRALTAQGYETERAADGGQALARFEGFDLIVLDLGLPDMDGLDVCRRIRQVDPLLPVVMVTARQAEIDIVMGLDAGAVDYIAKPFRLAELLARLRVQLRRTVSTGSAIEVGELTIDPNARRVWLAGAELSLRAKEFDLLTMLAAEAGTAITRERIMSEVWDEHWFGSTKTLDVHLASLRRKLGDEPGQPSRITTLRGVGYRYERK